jgi:hypothetical protein
VEKWSKHAGAGMVICLFLAIAFSFTALATGSLWWFAISLVLLLAGIWCMKVKLSQPAGVKKSAVHTEYERTHNAKKSGKGKE